MDPYALPTLSTVAVNSDRDAATRRYSSAIIFWIPYEEIGLQGSVSLKGIFSDRAA
jgi:hypothetical protein